MHPLIITPLFPPAVGGSATYFGQLAGLLASRPEIDRLTLLTEQASGPPPLEERGKLVILRLLPRRISMPPRPYLWHAASYLQTQFWFARRLPGLVKTEQIDLIHFHTRYRGRWFYQALRRSAVPVVADLRDKLTDPAQLLSVSQLLMCCCEGVRDFALTGGYPASRLRVIPMAFTPPPMPDAAEIQQIRATLHIGAEPYLLFLGDITANKGVLDLLPAFARWHERHPQVKLVLAGVNRLGKTFLDAMSATPGALYVGSVAHEQAVALIAGAEIVLLPSRSEGLPRVMLEALALNRRVLAPPHIPEFERYIPDYALSEISAPAIVAALERIWSYPPPPPFPFEPHRFSHVVTQILNVYHELQR
ncbi:MAG: glycosyltransferase family 4 protein [Chloroflexi bacterium]|nr:glycosyltransferase family 4 protein [Chloroflexota bacterium]